MKKELITYFIPKAPESEMFRNLRTNIQFMNRNKGQKVIEITSTMPGEGKSYVAANLAVTFAQSGQRTILVDADMRNGRQFNVFGVSPRPGLSNYLSQVVDNKEVSDEELAIENFIRKTDVENLSIIVAGSIPPNPSELLMNERMNELINILKSTFDVVIIDTPPALIVTDSVIIAKQVDSTLIVTSYGQTKKDVLHRVQTTLQNVGANIVGIVINKIPVSSNRYENKYYYYGYYGKKEEKNKKSIFSLINKNKKD